MSDTNEILLEDQPIITDAPIEELVLEPVVAPEPVPEIPELIYTYQPKDEQDRPIGGKQVIKYRTPEELADKLRDQSILLIRKLRSETKKNRLGISESEEIPEDSPRFSNPISFTPRQLNAEERVKASRDLLDPDNFESATEMLFEAAMGAKPKDVAATITGLQQDLINLKAKSEAEAFSAENPDYVRCAENTQAILNWMLRYDLAPTKGNFQKAHDALLKDDLLIMNAKIEAPAPVVAPVVIPAPVEQTVEPIAEPVAPTKFAPAAIPSGMHNGNSSEAVPVARSAGDDITYEETTNGKRILYKGQQAINRMPSDEFKRRVNNEPGFAKKVDKLEEELAKARSKRR